MHAGIVRKLLLIAGLVGALLLAFGLRAAARLPVPYLTQWEMRYDCSTPPVLTYNGDENCGPASMAMAVQADGKRESGLTDIAWVHTMRKRMTGYDDNGGCETVTSLPQMQTACSYYGLPCSRVQGEYALKRTVNLGFPFIAYVDSTRLLPRQYPEWMDGWHFIVVTGVCDVDGEALVYVNDPFSQSLGPGSYTFASFWDAFQAGGSDGLAVGPSFGTLFPDVLEYSGSGRKSWIAVRNGSPTAGTNVDVTYYSSSGSYYGTQCATLGGRESRAFAPSFSFLIGTSASSADKSVSTVVTTTEAFDSEAYAYSGVPSTPSVSGVGAGTDVFVPCNFYNYYGWSSEIYVQNANSAATTACALLYGDSGGTPIRTCNGINFGARQTFAFTNAMIGSVRVTATLPVGLWCVTSMAVSTIWRTMGSLAGEPRRISRLCSGITTIPGIHRTRCRRQRGTAFMCMCTIILLPPPPLQGIRPRRARSQGGVSGQ